MPERTSIERLRDEIDRVDDQLVRLLNRRARLALAVGRAKHSRGRSVYAPAREARVLARVARANRGPLTDRQLRAIFREITANCRVLQQPLRVAFLGPAGTYCQEAARGQFGPEATLTAAPSIDAVFDAVERGRADFGVVPVENSSEGVVAATLDRFVTSPLSIKAEVLLRVDHCLLARRRGPIRRIVAHPQALAQCRAYLAAHYPDAAQEEVASNAVAAALAARRPGTAAVAGRRAAARYGLEVLEAGIQDAPRNFTRFLVLAADDQNEPSGEDKTSLLFSVPHEAGALYRVLEVFARERLNLNSIESRPWKGRAWEYVFFVDVAAHRDDPAMARAVEALGRRVLFLRVLGSYPVCRWPQERFDES